MAITYAKLLDRQRKVVASLQNATVERMSRAKNAAGEVRLKLPLSDPKVSQVDIGQFIEVTRGNTVFIMEVTDRDKGETDVMVGGYTEEVLLKQIVCPQNYSALYRNIDLADFARDIVKGYQVIRIASQPQFDLIANGGFADEHYQVDINSYPNRVILGTDATDAYRSTGFVRLQFDAQDIPNFIEWDRVRFLSGNDDVVSSQISIAQTDTINESIGLDDYKAPPFADSRGVPVPKPSKRFLHISILLVTRDTTTPDNPDSPTVKGVTPVLEGVEVIARTTTDLTTSPDLPAALNANLGSLSADQTNGLELIREACEQLGYSFRVRNGLLEVAQTFGVDKSQDFVLVG